MELEQKVKARSYKQMLLVSMISMTMMFAGLTSAYVVSTKREDWVNFEIPQAFYISTLLILLGSLTFFLAKKAITHDLHSKTSLWLLVTLALGLGFVFFQLEGFAQLIDSGLYFTGEKSNIATSFLYVITMAHLVHMFAGLIVLIVILWKHQQKKYSSHNKLGLELGLIFWHFLDLLWLYLFLFFVFIN